MMSSKLPVLNSFRLVLVSPRVPGNVGACARLTANFELSDWVIVTPQCSWDGWDAKKLATGNTGELLDRIRVLNSVEEAVKDCSAAIGFSRRQGKVRKTTLEVGEIADLATQAGKIALVFGNEESGLSSDELSACTHLCSLRASEAMESLNLSHAVAVVLSRAYEHLAEAPKHRPLRQGIGTPVQLGELESLLTHWGDLLVEIGMKTAGNPERMLHTLRKVFARAQLSRQEIRAVRGVLSKIQVKIGTRSRGSKITPA